MAADRPPASYGPIQFARYLDLTLPQFERARRDGLIPGPDIDGHRWSRHEADECLDRADDIRQAAGELPDLGSARAALVLAERLGIEVEPDTVAELARTGHLAVAGTYKGYDLYDGRSLAAFNDRTALDQAARVGRLMTATAAATYLGVSRRALVRLVESGRIEAVGHGRSTWRRAVALYRTGDLNAVATELEGDPS